MIKAKFGDHAGSKSDTAVLCKIICHNMCSLTVETHELGIDPKFGLAARR